MAFPIRDAIQSAGRYAFRNPTTSARILGYLATMKIAVPLDALRWLASHLLTGSKAPTDVIITARPPALALGATVEAMKQKLRVSTAIKVESLDAGEEHLLATIRLQDLDLKTFDPKSPLNNLLKSGALDLSKPAALLNMLGNKKPKVIVSAEADRFELDLFQIPAIASNPTIRTVLKVLTPVVTVAYIRTDGDMLVIGLKASPGGVPRAFSNLRG